jgi:hypothetical protein
MVAKSESVIQALLHLQLSGTLSKNITGPQFNLPY